MIKFANKFVLRRARVKVIAESTNSATKFWTKTSKIYVFVTVNLYHVYDRIGSWKCLRKLESLLSRFFFLSKLLIRVVLTDGNAEKAAKLT